MFDDDFYPVDDEEYFGVGSARDCTGLIPAGLPDDELMEYYEDLYPYLPTEAD